MINKKKIILTLSIILNVILSGIVVYNGMKIHYYNYTSDITSNVDCNIVQKNEDEIIFKRLLSTDEHGENEYFVADHKFIYEFDVITADKGINLDEKICVVVQYNTSVDVKKKNGDTYIYIRGLVDVKDSKYPGTSL
ncbi:hypothetical protein [Ruminococcus gauvreauii]|uniref:Uncharacterized protein n=1 Tax=Ruminococcus gauvreauii TaxID=438033 RepID=A0ABY5VHR1_9FIRM|nr:hypothetical protein [Ruminococcus gauvreauii]UWP59862.1 hypothetical protein NQ502_02020 [Ruminococcus gauvreauii]